MSRRCARNGGRPPWVLTPSCACAAQVVQTCARHIRPPPGARCCWLRLDGSARTVLSATVNLPICSGISAGEGVRRAAQFILASSPEPGSGSSTSARRRSRPAAAGAVGPAAAATSRSRRRSQPARLVARRAARPWRECSATGSTRVEARTMAAARKGSMRTIRSQEQLPSEARREESGPSMLNGAQVAVSVAVLCDGPVEERMRMCFDAYDGVPRARWAGRADRDAACNLPHVLSDAAIGRGGGRLRQGRLRPQHAARQAAIQVGTAPLLRAAPRAAAAPPRSSRCRSIGSSTLRPGSRCSCCASRKEEAASHPAHRPPAAPTAPPPRRHRQQRSGSSFDKFGGASCRCA